MWRSSVILASILLIVLFTLSSLQCVKPVHAEGQDYQIFLPLVVNHKDAALPDKDREDFIDLARFVELVKTGKAETAGLYVENLLAKRVVQQPDGRPDFISNDPQEITRFRLTSPEVVGLLAHQHLAGKLFSEINPGDILFEIKGDGQIKQYRVIEIKSYQVVVEDTVKYRDITSNAVVTTTQLFSEFYLGGPHMTLQTCIAQGGNPAWGRLFIKALPLN